MLNSKVATLSLSALTMVMGCGHCPPRLPSVIKADFGSPNEYEPPPVDCELPASAMLAMDRIPQERSMTCWAASGQMAMALFGAQVSQCEQVRHRARASQCACLTCPQSASLPPGPCNNGGFPDFAAFGFDAKRLYGGALRLDEIKREIACRQSPVVFSWKDDADSDNPGGHMMVAYGYQGDMIAIMDPSPPCDIDPNTNGLGNFDNAQQITYAEYLSGPSRVGAHWDDFYAIHSRRLK